MGDRLMAAGDEPAARFRMMIRSLLDTDLYKFTMMQVVLHHFPGAHVEYRFKCRNGNVDLTPYIEEIRAEIRALCSLRFTAAELDYLRGFRFMKSDYVDLLGLFQLDDRFVDVSPRADSPTEIDISIKGPWLHTILFEVPVLAIVSEVYNRNNVNRACERGERAGFPHRRLRDASALLPHLARRGHPHAEERSQGQVRRHQ
jgi:nicotinate phosphoribosyltransferase